MGDFHPDAQVKGSLGLKRTALTSRRSLATICSVDSIILIIKTLLRRVEIHLMLIF